MANKCMKSRLALQMIRKTKTKTPMKYYFRSTSMAKVEKTENTKHWQGCGTTGILMRVQNQTTTLEAQHAYAL